MLPRTSRTPRRNRQQPSTRALLLGVMTAAAAPLLLCMLCLSWWAPRAAAQPDTAGYRSGWTLSQFPNPSVPGEAQQCGPYHAEAKGSTTYLCDPDAILTRQGAIQVHEALDRINAEVTVPCAAISGGEERVQLAVALVHKLRRTSYDVMEEAEGFARALHNEWGVGSAACQTGALLFLSRVDRAVYVSRGRGLEGLLTDHRIDQVINDARELLRRGEWDAGVLLAVQQLEAWILQGPPGFWERHSGMIILCLAIGALVAYAIYQEQKKYQDHRAYEDAKKKLERIERERARLASLDLAGSYQSLISCPICLEEFKDGAALEENDGGTIRRGTDKLGADDKPVSILACGHAYCNTCLLQSLERERTPRCPICRRTLDEGAEGQQPPGGGGGGSGGDGGPRPPPGGGGGGGGFGGFGGGGGFGLGGTGAGGGDGLGGTGRSSSGLEAGRGGSSGSTGSGSGGGGGRCRVDEDVGGGGGGYGNVGMGMGSSAAGAAERARARRVFAEAEILYRLSQLARQHPGIVRPDMVNRWTQRDFDGRFTSDPNFVNADPRVRFAQQQQAYGTSSYTSSSGQRYGRSFGGGSSSGGRGGRW